MGNQNMDKFKRRLIRSVARSIKENIPQDQLWANMKEATGYDCQVLWQRMRALTIKKLSRLLPAGDYPKNLTKVARMTLADWLMYDLVLVHEPINVIGSDIKGDFSEPLMELTELVRKFEVEAEEPEGLVHAWVLVTIDYNQNGRQCSPMLLQRRWYQLKESTKKTFYELWFKYYNNMSKCPLKPTDIQIKIAQCFPNVITSNFLEWHELVANKMVVMPEEVEKVMKANRVYGDDDQNTEPDVIILENRVETINLDQDSDNEDDTALKAIHHSNSINDKTDSRVTEDVTNIETSPNSENYLQRVKIEPNLKEPDSSEKILQSDTNIIGIMDSNAIHDLIEIDNVQGMDCNVIEDSTEIHNDQGTDCNVIDDSTEVHYAQETDCNGIEDSTEIHSVLETDCNVIDDSSEIRNVLETDCNVIDGSTEIHNVLETDCNIIDNSVKNLNIQGTDCIAVDHSTDLFSIAENTFRDKSLDHVCPEEDNGLSNVMIIATTHIPHEIPITTVNSATSLENETKTLSTKNEDSPTIKHESVDEQPLGKICMSEIEFVDDGIEFIDDYDHTIITPKEENREESYNNNSDDDDDDDDDDDNDLQQKFDPQLLMTPIVYTTKVDHMDILKDKDLANLNVNVILNDIIKQSKPEIHQLCKENLVTDDKIDIIAQSEQTEIITEYKTRIKLSSSLLKKPQCRTYNPIVLCKNPDFNTRLKRLPVGFFSFTRNRQLLKACDPVTIDLHKSFENKLINGTLYLKDDDDNETSDNVENIGLPKIMDSQPTLVTLPAQSLIDKLVINMEDSVPKEIMPMHKCETSFDIHHNAYEASSNECNLAQNTQEKEKLKINAWQQIPSENVPLEIPSVSSNVVIDKSNSLESTDGGESVTQMPQNIISESGIFDKTNSQFNVVCDKNQNGTFDKTNSQCYVVSDKNENGTYQKTNSQCNVVPVNNQNGTFDKTNTQCNEVTDNSAKANFLQQSTELRTGDGKIGVKAKTHPKQHVNVPWFHKRNIVHYEDVLLTIDSLNKMLKHLCKDDNFQQAIPIVKKSKQTECAPKPREISPKPTKVASIIIEQAQNEESSIQESQIKTKAVPKLKVVSKKRASRARNFCCWINRKMKKIELIHSGDIRRLRLPPHNCFKVSSICTCCCKEIYGSKIDEIEGTSRKNIKHVIKDMNDILETTTSNTTLLLNNEHGTDINTHTIIPELPENRDVEQNMYNNCESIILSDEEPCNSDADDTAYSNYKTLDDQNNAMQSNSMSPLKIQSEKGKISIDGTSPLLHTVALPIQCEDSEIQNANTQLFIIRPHSTNKPPITLGKNRILLTTASLLEDEANESSCLNEDECLTTKPKQNIASDSNYVLPNGVQLLLLPNGQVTAIFEPNAEILSEDEMTKLQNLISTIQEEVSTSDLSKQIQTNTNYSDQTCSNEVHNSGEIDLTGSPVQPFHTDKSDNEGLITCNGENENAELTIGDKHKVRTEEDNKIIERSITEVDKILDINVDSLLTITEGLQTSVQIQETDLLDGKSLASKNINNIQISDKSCVQDIEETNTEEQNKNKKTYLQIKPFATFVINKTSENIENSGCNSNEKKSILSDLMQLSGISTEDSKVCKVNEANSSNLIDVNSSLKEKSFDKLSATSTVPELTPITSEKELKLALQNNGKFYTFNLGTGQIYSVKIHIRKKDKVLFPKFVNKKTTTDNNIIELGDSDDDKEISKTLSINETSQGKKQKLKKIIVKKIVRKKDKIGAQKFLDAFKTNFLSKQNCITDNNKRLKIISSNRVNDNETIEIVDSDENMGSESFGDKAKIKSYGNRRKKRYNFTSICTSDNNNSSDEEPLAKKAKRKSAQALHDADIIDRPVSKQNKEVGSMLENVEGKLSNVLDDVTGEVDLNTEIQSNNFVDCADKGDQYNIYGGPFMLGDSGEDNSNEDCILGV